MSLNLLSLFFLLSICGILSFYISRFLYFKAKKESILTDNETLNLVNILQPWIQSNIEKSTEFVIQMYMIEVNKGNLKKKISMNEYHKIIDDIKNHFYGSIPISVNIKFLSKYIDIRQIDILIHSAFRIYNDNFFTITQKEEVV